MSYRQTWDSSSPITPNYSSIAGLGRIRSIAGLGRLGGNLLILKLVRAHLVFVGQPAQAHLQDSVGAVASEATASVGLFSKI
jgi:hypothetical protein